MKVLEWNTNEFNEYYIEKIDKLRKTIPESSMNRTVMNKFEGEKLSAFSPTTDEELREIIGEFGVKTSVEDPLPTKVLKQIAFRCNIEIIKPNIFHMVSLLDVH